MQPVLSSRDTGYGTYTHCNLFLLPDPSALRSKIIQNLAVVNYDTNNLYLAPYDWRLSYYNLEERDGYFSNLKSMIELFKYVVSISFAYIHSNDSIESDKNARL
jgi:hypothetical protein